MSGWLSYKKLLVLWHPIIFHVIHFPCYFTLLFYLYTEQLLWNNIPMAKTAKWEWPYVTVLMQCLVSVFPRPREYILRTAKYVISYRRCGFEKGADPRGLYVRRIVRVFSWLNRVNTHRGTFLLYVSASGTQHTTSPAVINIDPSIPLA